MMVGQKHIESIYTIYVTTLESRQSYLIEGIVRIHSRLCIDTPVYVQNS